MLAVFALNFNALFTEYDMSATFQSSYGKTYAMIIQNMCAEEAATTERRIADHTGREFIVRTAGTCTYATEPVPQGTGSVYGIIDYFNGKYTLRIANREVDFATVAARPTACPSSGGYSAPKPTR